MKNYFAGCNDYKPTKNKAMKKTYNGIFIPDTIKTNFILSAFANCIDNDKIESYSSIMKDEMLSHSFPPINGFPIIIDENDMGDYFLNGEEVSEIHLGKLAWKVTDGHHRTIAAINGGLPYLEVELDYSCIISETDFINYKQSEQ